MVCHPDQLPWPKAMEIVPLKSITDNVIYCSISVTPRLSSDNKERFKDFSSPVQYNGNLMVGSCKTVVIILTDVKMALGHVKPL